MFLLRINGWISAGRAFWLACLFMGFAGAAQAQASLKMALLLPDNLSITSVQASAWLNSAQELGYPLAVVRNSQFLQAGTGLRATYAGLIVPDLVQTVMADNLVQAIETYVSQGGKLMLVYDAGALNQGGFYAAGRSRFSDLVGVDYLLYDTLGASTVGLGPVLGAVSQLRALQVPPGKSIPYVSPSPESPSATQQLSARTVQNKQQTPSGSVAAPVNAATVKSSYLSSGVLNPTGLMGYAHNRFFQTKLQGLLTVPARAGAYVSSSVSSTVYKSGATAPIFSSAKTALAKQVALDPVHSISGYAYGSLVYPSYVTRPTQQAKVLLSSPAHGVIASQRTVGSGEVLFVNLPLTYLKLSDDAMLMNGFLHSFARYSLHQPRLSDVPKGIGGMVLNWHLDSMEAQEPIQALKTLGVWNYKPFSIHMTAGPDTIVPGDKLGFDLPNNPVAQQFLRDFVQQGHAVASHGGWIHDYYGYNADETNSAQFLNYLALNRKAVQSVTMRVSTEYSAPQGNNPTWALNWLKQTGVQAYYSLSHTGTGPTRTYRNGALVQPALWAIPVVPFGSMATFEDFDEQQVPAADILKWYQELIDFNVNNETSRLIYAHPPGAMLYPTVLTSMLQYAQQYKQQGVFNWYTMTQLAQFMKKRSEISWDIQPTAGGKVRVSASHPSSLANATWIYPKNLYSRPQAVSGVVNVIDRDSDWLVQIVSGSSASFDATPL
jgi:hypothetical protein